MIYVGTGEENPRNNASIGDGMYKSVDGGEHWTHIGLEKTRQDRAHRDRRAAIPTSSTRAALGREWGPNEERGVFKTVDGGKTWKKVLYVDPQTACSDIAADPGNSNIIYAGMYTYRRWAWHLESGGGNTAVYKSVNGGDTWERLSGKGRERGLPKRRHGSHRRRGGAKRSEHRVRDQRDEERRRAVALGRRRRARGAR